MKDDALVSPSMARFKTETYNLYKEVNMVFLTSTGFTNPRVYEILIENAKKIEKACIVTTAAIPSKEKNT